MSRWPLVPVGAFMSLRSPDVDVSADQLYQFAGVYCFGKGLFVGEKKTGLDFSYKRLTALRQDDFVYPKLMAWEGAFAIVPADYEGFVVSTEFPVFNINRSLALPRYISNYFRMPSVWNAFAGASTGTNVRRRRLNPSDFLSRTLPLPPIDEQRRVVTKIDGLVEKIEIALLLRGAADHETDLLNIRRMEEVRKSLLLRTARTEALGEITKVTSGGTPSRDNPAFWGGKIPWIKTGELLDGDISIAKEHLTQLGVENSSAKLFPKDTVLIALYGQGQTRGRTGRLLIPATTNQACAAVLPCEQLRPRYAQYWLRSLYREMREDNHGGAQPNWNGQMIKDVKIAILSLEDQDRVVEYLDALTSEMDRVKHDQGRTGRELAALSSAILNEAFKGKL